MKCGKVEELVQWTADAIVANNKAVILVATSNAEEGEEVMARIEDKLREHLPSLDGWRFANNRVRSPQGGYIDLYSGYADRLSRGYNPDLIVASETVPSKILEAGQWLEKSS